MPCPIQDAKGGILGSIKFEHIDTGSVTTAQVGEWVAFHNAYYHDSRKPESWMWEYASFEKDKSVFVVARDEGRIVATQGMLPIYLNVGGERVLTGKSESTLLLPEYRGQKLMERLHEYAVDLCKERGLQFLWGFTGAVKVFQKFGYTTYQDAAVDMSRPGIAFWRWLAARYGESDPITHRVGSMGKYCLNYILKMRRLPVRFIAGGLGLEVERKTVDSSRLSGFQAALGAECKSTISLHLDDRYVNWRIRANPNVSYLEYQVTEAGRLQALAFVAETKGAINISCIQALTESSFTRLLQSIIEDNLTKTGFFGIFHNKHCPLENVRQQVYQHFGFTDLIAATLVVRDLSNGKRELNDVGNWDLNGLWTEGYSW